MLRGDRMLFAYLQCPPKCHSALKKKKKNEKNVFKNLTQMLMCSCHGDVVE